MKPILLVTLIFALFFMMVSMEERTVCGSAPQGFLIVTRQVFVDSLNQYIAWKNSCGFAVHVVTAEWINDHVEGSDLRAKIRNCIRGYYRDDGVKYVILIGDAEDVSSDDYGKPPPTPTLSENWSLPAGYYSWDSLNGTQYTSLYYSDLSEKVEYNVDEYNYAGDYEVYVGIVPVRTPDELQVYLSRTINYAGSLNTTLVFSLDTSSPWYAQAIQSIAGSDLSIDVNFFDQNSSSEQVHEKIFNREGVIYESGHGNLDVFVIGNVWITNENASDFQFVNPLMLTSSCLVQAYNMYPECLDEAFLKASKGPVVILTGPPEGPIGLIDNLSDLERGFWADLFAGKTIGQSLYEHCSGAWQNPIELFGDPSLVIFDASENADIAEFPSILLLTSALTITAIVVVFANPRTRVIARAPKSSLAECTLDQVQPYMAFKTDQNSLREKRAHNEPRIK